MTLRLRGASGDASSGVRCRACGEHVTPQFARVFGDNDDAVRACPACATYRELQDRAGAGGSR